MKWTIRAREFANCNRSYGMSVSVQHAADIWQLRGGCRNADRPRALERHAARRLAVRRHSGATKVEARQRLSSMPERGKRSAEPCCELSQGRTPNLARRFFKSSPPLSRRCTSPSSPPSTSTWMSTRVAAGRHRGTRRTDQDSGDWCRLPRAQRHSQRL